MTHEIFFIIIICALGALLQGALVYQKMSVPEFDFKLIHIPDMEEINQNINRYNTSLTADSLRELQYLISAIKINAVLSAQQIKRKKRTESFFDHSWCAQFPIYVLLYLRLSKILSFNAYLTCFLTLALLVASCGIGVFIAFCIGRRKKQFYTDANEIQVAPLAANDCNDINGYIFAEYTRCYHVIENRIECIKEYLDITESAIHSSWASMMVICFVLLLLSLIS